MSAKCKNCGAPIDGSGDPPRGRAPCPRCGSVSRAYSVSLVEGVKAGDHYAKEHQRNGERIGFSESPRDGLASYGFKEDTGELRFGLEGAPPQGEQDTLAVCNTLILRLNQEGADWSLPVESDGDVDGLSTSSSKPNERLLIQVVRAVSDPDLWKKLASSGKVSEENRTSRDLVADLKSAIEHKADERRIPRRRRGDLVLALDASRLPAHALDVTVASFRDEHATWAGSLGFQAIWLVGPSVSLTTRLC